jgi:hypothetical protein
VRATCALLLGRVGGVFAVAPYLLLLVASLLPRVEDPLPDEIGLGVLLIMAGAGGVLGGVLFAFSAKERREWAINRGGVIGFGIGFAYYLAALLVQVASGI